VITSNIAFYPCICIEETDAFYSNVIGLEKVFSGERVRIFSTVQGHFGFMEYLDKLPASGRLCLSLNCPSETWVDTHYERISRLVATLDVPKKHATEPVYSFFVKDPNGYLVEFQKIKGLDI